MDERQEIVEGYRQWLKERWRKKRMTVEDVHDLKTYCRVHAVTPSEHIEAIKELGIDRRELIDEHNQPFENWLAVFQAGDTNHIGWIKHRSKASPPWRRHLWWKPGKVLNILAIAAALAMIAGVIGVAAGIAWLAQ
ncbi:MAG TPA: hypothetical protein VIO61_14355 [Anaerolineaceae bacterium]